MRPKLALHAEDYEKKKKIVEHLRSIGNYIKKNKIKQLIVITDNASFHVSRKTKQFVEKQLHWLTAIKSFIILKIFFLDQAFQLFDM